MDISISKDNRVVVSHEPFMNPIICFNSNGDEIPEEDAMSYNLYAMDYEEIKKYDCGTKVYPTFPDQKNQKTFKPLLSDVFQLVDHLLTGNLKQYAKILRSLELEGSESSLVLWAILREINSLLTIAYEKHSGKPLSDIFKALRIWQSKQQIILRYFQQNKIYSLYAALQFASDVEKTIKGLNDGQPWQMLLKLGLILNGKKL